MMLVASMTVCTGHIVMGLGGGAISGWPVPSPRYVESRAKMLHWNKL